MEALLAALEPTLRQIASEHTRAARNPRIEYDDLLQDARIGALIGLRKGKASGLAGKRLLQYATGAARIEVRDAIRKQSSDALFDADNLGLLGLEPEEDGLAAATHASTALVGL